MKFQFIHAADVHLDSPQLHLERYDGAPVEQFRLATRQAFENLIDLAIERAVAFVVLAGDLYDGECRDMHTPIFFRQQMQRLRAQGIRVAMLQGNHDAASVTKRAFKAELPDNCHMFPTGRAETLTWDDWRVAVHGRGFAEREVTEDLSLNYPTALPGYLNIGVLHTNCGNQDAHDSYAPSSVAGLSAKGYDYWALGHIHKFQVLSEGSPWIVYPGNIQGRHIREDGPKGCVLVSVADDRIVDVQRHCLDVVRWHTSRIDITSCDDGHAVLRSAWQQIEAAVRDAEQRPLAVRCELHGHSTAHRELRRNPDHWEERLRETVLEKSEGTVWLEKIEWYTRSPKGETTAASESLPSELLALLVRASLSAENLQLLTAEFRDLAAKCPSDPRLNNDRIDPEESESMYGLMEEARELLLGRLLHEHDSVG